MLSDLLIYSAGNYIFFRDNYILLFSGND